jgi:hypothetical protein
VIVSTRTRRVEDSEIDILAPWLRIDGNNVDLGTSTQPR